MGGWMGGWVDGWIDRQTDTNLTSGFLLNDGIYRGNVQHCIQQFH